jgi:phosphomannomutase
MSKESAELAASVLTANRIHSVLSDSFCPTPAVSYMTQTRNATAGIMITASHNPANYNGIKFKESYGGAACPEYVQPIEAQIARNIADKRSPKTIGLHNEYFTTFNAHMEYTDAIQKLIDLKAIQSAG